LSQVEDRDTNKSKPEEKPQKPPSIFVYGVVNLPEMLKNFQDIVELDEYTTRSMANDTVKLNCSNPDAYRKLVRFMKDNIIYHTYQPKEERSYSVTYATPAGGGNIRPTPRC
jgi:hypothetical protein